MSQSSRETRTQRAGTAFGARWLLLGLTILVCAPGVGAETESDSEAGWIPSLSGGIGFQMQGAEGTVASTLRGVAEGSETIVQPIAPVGLQLEAPPARVLPGTPRPFVHGEVQFMAAPERTLVRNGTPGQIVVPDRIDPLDNPDSVGNQGQSLQASYTYQWVAGIGLAFPVTILGSRVQLKPSLDYMGQFVEFEASLAHLACPDGGQACQGGPFGEPTYLGGLSSEIFHALGPRLAVEVDSGNRGPVGVSVFVSGQVYFFLDGPKASGTDTNAAGDVLRWDYNADPWVLQAAVGVRFRWKGR